MNAAGRGDLLLLFVVNAHEFTAAHRLPLLFAARSAGYRVEAVAPLGSPAARRLDSEGFPTHTVELSRRGVHLWQEFRALRQLKHLYRRLAPGIVHHATIKPVLYGTVAARLAQVPAVVNTVTGLGYVYTGNDWRARCLRVAVSAAFRFGLRHPCQKVIFQNEDDLAVLGRIARLDRSQTVTIPGSGVDVEFFSPAPESAGTPTVVLPARVIGDKGVREFVAAARVLRRAGVEARFVLVGGLDEGNPTAISEEQVRNWVQSGAIEWWGQADDMRKVYRSAAIVVLPSYREGLPKVVLEAGACARPVITTDAPGCRDSVVHGKTGFLVPVRDHAELARRIEELVFDSGRRWQMGRNAREFIETNFSTGRVADETLAVYQELIGECAV